jgi:hypothetical protein
VQDEIEWGHIIDLSHRFRQRLSIQQSSNVLLRFWESHSSRRPSGLAVPEITDVWHKVVLEDVVTRLRIPAEK